MFLTCSNDESIHCFDVETAKIVGNYIEHVDIIYDIEWFSDNVHFLSVSVDGFLKKWNILNEDHSVINI